MHSVSIVVPVYNVENFIQRCVISLFEQDYEDIEYVFVNDCSSDNSMKVLSDVIKKYPQRQKNIKIINNKKNCGSQQTREIGINHTNGEYILCVDSDDWLEFDTISFLYKKAKEFDADIMIFDMYMEYKNKSIPSKAIKDFLNIDTLNKNNLIKESLKRNMSSSLCTKLIKKDIYKKIKFAKFSHAEDYYISMQLFFYANKVKYINQPFYHYNKINDNSMSTVCKFEKAFNDFKALNAEALSFINKHNLGKDILDAYYIGLIVYVFYNIKFDTLKTLKDINPSAAKIKYIWINDHFGILEKISCSLVFLRLEFLYRFGLDIYKKIKRN